MEGIAPSPEPKARAAKRGKRRLQSVAVAGVTAASTDACEAVSNVRSKWVVLPAENASGGPEGLAADEKAKPLGDGDDVALSTVMRAYSSTSRTGRRVFRSPTSRVGMGAAGVEARAGAEANGGSGASVASPLVRAVRIDAERGRVLSPSLAPGSLAWRPSTSRPTAGNRERGRLAQYGLSGPALRPFLRLPVFRRMLGALNSTRARATHQRRGG